MQNILVIGGAGYIGSHMVALLNDMEGYNPIVLDNLSSGHKQSIFNTTLIKGDYGNHSLLDKVFNEHNIAGVIHFASFINVGESTNHPSIYYDNNVIKTLNLLNSIIKHNIQNFIFSSSAAVYGEPNNIPINESHDCKPINPYGKTKFFVEQILEDYKSAYGLKYGCLRYFNAAGAHPSLNIGERHDPETHLIPLVLRTASGKCQSIKIFGNDYHTPDGTCIRDYIHVCDLADAHLKLFEYMQAGGEEEIFNLGTGTGYSVRNIIETSKQITGKNIAIEYESRRIGDPESLVADGSKAKKTLNWKPKFSDIETIIKDAWRFEQRLVS